MSWVSDQNLECPSYYLTWSRTYKFSENPVGVRFFSSTFIEKSDFNLLGSHWQNYSQRNYVVSVLGNLQGKDPAGVLNSCSQDGRKSAKNARLQAQKRKWFQHFKLPISTGKDSQQGWEKSSDRKVKKDIRFQCFMSPWRKYYRPFRRHVLPRTV